MLISTKEGPFEKACLGQENNIHGLALNVQVHKSQEVDENDY